ncbi:MAG: FtsX-like permease family protein, partial [Phaeodactylibacter sp.]|nr:FtsX-like permease family protein [Phaeodactylibacter sp.]
ARFTIKKIVPVEGRWADESLMPQLPGLSDAGNCRDWETGVPIGLEKIRDKDEAYWKQYRGTPKAYISYTHAGKLWKSRFGESTIIRFAGGQSDTDIENTVKEYVDPFQLGFKVESVKDNARLAARNGVDFSQLFLGLSFFLITACILLTVLLFQLNTEQRSAQVDTLSFLGFTNRQVKGMLLAEGMLVVLAGAAFGLLLAAGYNEAVFAALNSIWADIVRTQTLVSVLRPATFAIGFLISTMLSLAVIYLSLSRLLRQGPHTLQVGIAGPGKYRGSILKNLLMSGSGMAAALLVAWSYTQSEFRNAGVFFAAGGLLLLSLLLGAHKWIHRGEQASERPQMTTPVLIGQNIRRNASRSFLVVAIFALAAFIIVSTGANRRDFFSDARDKSSGTGGFLFFAESTIPVLNNLNTAAIRFEAGLEKEYTVVQLLEYQGDDASCLNLNRTASPRILGVNPKGLAGRFSFTGEAKDMNIAPSWHSLEQGWPGHTIPAIADQTVIQWGLGLKVGDTLQYVDENGATLNLKLIGGLANSIFQGSVLISQDNFLRHFPSVSGSNVFLIDGKAEQKAAIQQELQQSFRDYGWTMQEAAARLAEFNSVENTYLSIFMALGGLGLIIGTIGLAIVLARNLLNRRNELGLLQALGFPKALILRVIVLEHLYLLLMGVGIGLATSLLATLPAWLNPHIEGAPWSITLLLSLIFANGVLWIVLITRRFLDRDEVVKALRSE